MNTDEVPEQDKYQAPTKVPIITRGRDIAIGFFGWTVFHNLYFLIGMQSNMLVSTTSSILFAALPFAIGLVALILARKLWIGAGVVIAILTATMIWLYFGLPILAFLLPFPVGMGLLMQ